MTDQPTLPTAPRLHDLPPRWDGHRVEWGGWRTPPSTTLDPNGIHADCCTHCGAVAPRVINFGVVWARPAGLIAFPARRRWDARGTRDGGDHAAQWLTAYRCPVCRTDEVEDRTTRELWVLEDSDYGDDGSYA